MRPLFIVAVSEGVKGLLLSLGRRLRWVSCLLIQRPVKPLQSAVLLWMTRLDTLWGDSQLDPPHRQSSQTSQPDARKGRSIVCTDSPRQPVLLKHPLHHSAHLWRSRSSQTTTGEKVSRRCILHGQRVDPLTICRSEPSLEVHTPHVVGINILRERVGPRRSASASPATLHQSCSIQYLPRRTRRRPACLRLPSSQPRYHLLRSPRWVSSLRLDQLPCHLRTGPIRMGVRCSAEVTQAIIPPLLESVDALVTRLSTDFEPAAQLRDGLSPPRPHLDEHPLLRFSARLLPPTASHDSS